MGELAMLDRAQAFCVTCFRSAARLGNHYRGFLLDPATLFTIASGILLIAASIQEPLGFFLYGEQTRENSPLFAAAAVVGSSFIWWSALQGMRRRDFTADVPVSVATVAAILIGQYSAAAVVAVLLLLGGMLENFVAARAGKALDELAKLLPDHVTLRRGGRDLTVPFEEVRTGDLLLIRSGERIAVDGEIVSGSASVDQSAITGESLPVEKTVGDVVYAGTLNASGAFDVRATKVGTDTTLGQIRRMMEAARIQKAPIERLLDRYAKLYTPAALILGALVWWYSGDLLRAITILIVFCPCVMVLATPTALVASIGNAALRGTLVKQGATVEVLARVDTVVFDKTGTLTKGKPRLVRTLALDGWREQDLLRFAAIAEKFSEHPLGRAVVEAAEAQKILVTDPEEFAPLPGLGVQARAGSHRLVLGSGQFLTERRVANVQATDAQVNELAAPGRNVILVAINQAIAGMLVLEDAVRPEAKMTLARLHRLGIRTAMVTGDHSATAERIARELGIREIHAQVMPNDKVDIVRQMQSQGCRVAFVGDGVNDAPALAAADVGIAMGLGGTDVAIETAEVALLSDDLSKIPQQLMLSRQAVRAIRQNLAFSLGVLALAIGLSVPGILTPVTGALLHELSSIPVIANSARLIAWNSKEECSDRRTQC